ncbi:hypothetical protein BN1708_014926 [Verticillium longisporum]|uniref:Nitrate reductase [NADPH] n=1 Tax=Verticillium longisporum TaxID=100787 RepID=A0A0G4M0B5_VERLO|nr:hypothetical protein BN1708_014926 [Verticillium longisporum]
MGGTSHFVVEKRDHPGSSEQAIENEPDWGAGHNHRVGFKNVDGRVPGYSGEPGGPKYWEKAMKKYEALLDRKRKGELINFRDVIDGEDDLRLIHPQDRAVGVRFALDCTEDWVKYGQKWPINEAKKKKVEEKKKKREEEQDSQQNGAGKPAKPAHDDKTSHGDLKDGRKNDVGEGETLEDKYTDEERALLRALQHEKDYMANLGTNDGNQESPQKHNRCDVSIDEADQFTPDNWFPRSAELIRLTGKHPLNAEAPLTGLLAAGLITPNELHYVRNHGAVPRLMWEYHTVDINDGKLTLTMDELKHGYRSINIPVFMACDGNRRKELNMMRRTQGFNWGAGGGGCAYWKGALLRDVLLAAGVPDDLGNDGPRRWVNFEGSEDLSAGKYATCIPLAYAMDPRNDVMLAYEMNDLPLPPDHGYPVRVIIPGHVGGRCVKWLKRVWVSEKENASYYHIWDNRVLPSFVTDNESPFAETMFRHPGTACMEQNLNSVIVHPQQGEKMLLKDAGKGKGAEYRIQGFAYDGGGHEVQRVEVSLDDGETWLYCIRKFPDLPIRHGKKFWTWCHWHVDVPLHRMVQARSIMVKCWNVFKNSQPRDPAWNLKGMMNNCWYTVKSEIAQDDETDGAYVLFRHPTEPANGDGGWMQPSVVNQIELAKREAGTPQKQFTREEIEKHDSEDDCWIVVDGKVYDATSVMSWHPGGKAPIMVHAGRVHAETTEEFGSIHDGFAYEKLKECLLGTVTNKAANFIKENGKKQAAEKAKSKGDNKATLQKHRWVPTKLIARKAISEDTRAYTFQLPDHKAILGLGTCQHILIGFHLKDKMLVRSYTPTRPILPALNDTPDRLPSPAQNGIPNGRGAKERSKAINEQHHDLRDGDGTFELVVKTYFPTDQQPGGAMSNILDCMPLGEEVEIRGPTGDIVYLGNGTFLIDGEERKYRRVSLVLGGSGVTPGFSLLSRVIMSGDDETEIRVVDANNTEADILLREEMEELVKKSKGQLKVVHVLSRPSDEWKGLTGYVTGEILKNNLFAPGEGAATFVCGPPVMMQKAVLPAMKEWGYEEDKDLFGF